MIEMLFDEKHKREMRLAEINALSANKANELAAAKAAAPNAANPEAT
ncbi:hypothetical protein ACVWZM_005598 [Bradyrhizobium sp. USDA 4501]